jgi:hypothetical protein
MRFVGIEKLKGQEKNEARRNRPTRNKEWDREGPDQ